MARRLTFRICSRSQPSEERGRGRRSEARHRSGNARRLARPLLLQALLLPALLLGAPAFAPNHAVASGGHPHFHDGGVLEWFHDLNSATYRAKQTNKLVFVELGRRACPNCRHLVSQLLPQAGIRSQLRGSAIGLAVDADRPERAALRLFRQNLPRTALRSLPYGAFLRPDGSWILGWSGRTSRSQLQRYIARARTHLAGGPRGTTAEAPVAVPPGPEGAPEIDRRRKVLLSTAGPEGHTPSGQPSPPNT